MLWAVAITTAKHDHHCMLRLIRDGAETAAGG